jgi:very-short-patch-repair endonuclease
MSRYDDWNDDDSDDGYDAARDAYLTGEGPAVTRKQREEVEAWNEECRRNGW